jgi:hypothetical protein
MQFRRQFIAGSIGTITAPLAIKTRAAEPPPQITDVNVHLHRWPHHRLPHDQSPNALLQHLQSQGVTKAIVGSFDYLLQDDLRLATQRLVRDCKQSDPTFWQPVASITLRQTSWQDDLSHCIDHLNIKILRLYPGFHGYTLDQPAFGELLERTHNTPITIQIISQLEDPRTQHPAARTEAIKLSALNQWLTQYTDCRIMVLNASASMIHTQLQPRPNLWIDIAKLEGCGVIETLLKTWPAQQLAFGSNAPFFYWQAANLKLRESALNTTQTNALLQSNFLG